MYHVNLRLFNCEFFISLAIIDIYGLIYMLLFQIQFLQRIQKLD